MIKKRRRKKKLRWWTKAKRSILELMSRRETVKPVRKRRSKQRQTLSLQKIWQNLFLQFKPEGRRRRRRSKKRPLAQKIGRSCSKLMIFLPQQITKLFAPQKRRKRRKRKQYAVYVMANQKKVD